MFRERFRCAVLACVILAVASPVAGVPADGPGSPAPPGARDLAVAIVASGARQTQIGAGVVIGRDVDLTIATAAHVLRSDLATDVRTPDGDRLSVRSIELVPGHDLALIHTTTTAAPARIPALGRIDPRGGRYFLWGHPRGKPFVLARATLVADPPDLPAGPVGRFTIACSACDVGDSGAGLFDARGTLVGILTDLRVDATGKATGLAVVEEVEPAAHAAGRRVPAL